MKKEKKGKWTKGKEVWQYQLGVKGGEMKKEKKEPKGVFIPDDCFVKTSSASKHSKGTGGSTYTIANPGVTATYGKRNTWQYCPHCGKRLQ